jgi:hypothetical protein
MSWAGEVEGAVDVNRPGRKDGFFAGPVETVRFKKVATNSS